MYQRIEAGAFAALLTGLLHVGTATAQAGPVQMTIGDLSAVQRAAIEEETRRTKLRMQAGSEGILVPPPSQGATAIPVVATPASSPASAPRALVQSEPRMAVTGVAKLRGGWVVEVVTDSGAYLLGAGQAVPQTAWLVDVVDEQQVVLSRPGERKGSAINRRFTFKR